jgi:hypothetical protein
LPASLPGIGIAHGQEFKPDKRMKKIADAAAVGQAAGRALQWQFADAHPDWAYYEGSNWGNMLFKGGAYCYADFDRPTRIDDDSAFATRTMLRLNIGFGSSQLYEEPLK